MSLFKIPVTDLKGFGEKRAEQFKKLGVCSVGDLITFYPRTYEDWSKITKIKDIKEDGVYCVRAFLAAPVSDSKGRNGILLSKGTVYDDSGSLPLVFFNNRFISSMLEYGGEYFFFGKISFNAFGAQMVSPAFSQASQGKTIQPVYRQTGGLNSRTVANAVRQALEMLPDTVGDPLPERVRKRFGLCGLREALENIHFPKDEEALENARRRLIAEELVVLNLGMRSIREHGRGVSGVRITRDFSAEFEELLPFKLTKAQKRAISDCVTDITEKGSPMNRLVQGDVGSGKTAVAASVCHTVIKNGFQAAFMAPTEILARQHYETLYEFLAPTGARVELLTGAMKEREKKRVREGLASGEIDLVIGTHALITDKTEFKSLALAVTDEQHRFGVAQRSRLLSKGKNPHLLVMSATPIPRTLGLIIFGDLDISVIDELPPGRKPVITARRFSNQRGKVFGFLKSEIAMGRQAYIVCPLVEEGELENVVSAEEYAAELMLGYFSDIPVEILHGQLKPSEKEKIMTRFSEGETKLLVATTVVEVGVDVPNASVMVIENAERFGLSQLHQLRGRVGRGKTQSYCILISDSRSREAAQRFDIMCATNDGFRIADEDLKMRGPGDFFGSRQHGLPQLAIADLADTKSVELSQRIADYILYYYKDLRNDELRLLKAEIDRLFEQGGQQTLN